MSRHGHMTLTNVRTQKHKTAPFYSQMSKNAILCKINISKITKG
jgi:hypothetical protein